MYNIIEDSCLAVKNYLVTVYGIDADIADKYIQDSKFKKSLLIDPEFVNHWTAEVWAEEVFKEFNQLQK